MATADQRLQELKIILPPPPKPVAKYKPTVQIGNVLYVSRHGPAKYDGQVPISGKVGSK